MSALESEHPEFFHRVMRGCRALSDSAPEIDGLDDLLERPEQAIFDLALGREQRRDAQGYITPVQAGSVPADGPHPRPAAACAAATESAGAGVLPGDASEGDPAGMADASASVR